MEGAVALYSSSAVIRSVSAAEGKTDPHTWALLADTHLAPLPAFNAKDQPIKDRAAQLLPHFRAVSRDVQSLGPRPSGLILNGDCVEFGTAEDYELLLGSVADLRKAGIPLHLTLGNHDHRPHFLERLPESLGIGGKVSVPDRFVSVVEAGRANFFLLDSPMMEDPNRGGMLGKTQLEWLAKALDEHPDRPAIVVAHHNVNYQERPGSKVETIAQSAAPTIKAEGGLLDTKEFLDVLLARRHVKACFCGHRHQFRVVRYRGVYFVFQPAVGYPFHPADAAGWLKLRLLDEGAELQMRSLDPKYRHHLKQMKMKWS